VARAVAAVVPDARTTASNATVASDAFHASAIAENATSMPFGKQGTGHEHDGQMLQTLVNSEGNGAERLEPPTDEFRRWAVSTGGFAPPAGQDAGPSAPDRVASPLSCRTGRVSSTVRKAASARRLPIQ
jgi:hypothetical protein